MTIETKLSANGRLTIKADNIQIALNKALEQAINENGDEFITIVRENGDMYSINVFDHKFMYRNNSVKVAAEYVKKFASGNLKSNVKVNNDLANATSEQPKEATHTTIETKITADGKLTAKLDGKRTSYKFASMAFRDGLKIGDVVTNVFTEKYIFIGYDDYKYIFVTEPIKPAYRAFVFLFTSIEEALDRIAHRKFDDNNICRVADLLKAEAKANLTPNQKLATHIVAKLGNLIVKCESGEYGTRKGEIIRYETFTDEKDEFGTDLSFVEVFTDDTNFILDHVNLIKGFGENKVVETFYFTKLKATDNFEAELAKLNADVDSSRKDFKDKERVFEEARAAMREACNVYEAAKLAREKFFVKTADELTNRLCDLPADCRLKVKSQSGESVSVDCGLTVVHHEDHTFKDCFLITMNGGCEEDWCGIYDTPAQVETVISRLKDAINRGDTTFRFPSAAELVDNDKLADSLNRAMKVAFERYQDFCRDKNLTSAVNELALYNICRKASTQLRKEA